MDFKEITKKLKNNKNTYASVLFGSRAKGTSRKDSDYDIAVFVKDTKAIKELEKLKTKDFDIIPYSKLPLYVKAQVFKHGKPLFIKNDKQFTLDIYTAMKYYKDNLHHYSLLKQARV